MDVLALQQAKADAKKRYGTLRGSKFRRCASRALRNNSIELAVMSSPPTITTGTATLDSTLTKNVYSTASPASFTYRGGTPEVYSSVYYRFPVVTLPSGTGNADATHSAVGWAVEFHTDAPKVQVVVTNTTSAGLKFEVDGVSTGAVVPYPSTGGTGFFLLDFTGVGGRVARRIRVEGNFATAWRGVQINPTANVWPITSIDSVVVANVGDSTTIATGATDPNGGYNAIAAKLLGWADIRQIGLGGSGFIATGPSNSMIGDASRVADAVATTPDLLIVTGSQNDVSYTAAAIQAAALAAFQAYRTALPSVPIVVTGVFASNTGPSASCLACEAAILAAFNQWADPNSFYIPMSNDPSGSWVFGTGNVLTRAVTDGVLNGTTTVTSATANFTNSDVGFYITGTGIPANATIASRVNATTVTISSAATTSASGVSLTITRQNGSGNSDYYTYTDGAHPSAEGHGYMARRFAHAFRALVLPTLT